MCPFCYLCIHIVSYLKTFYEIKLTGAFYLLAHLHTPNCTDTALEKRDSFTALHTY